MAFAGVSGRTQRNRTPLSPLSLEARRRIVFTTLSPLYESIDNVSRSIVEYVNRLTPDMLPATIKVTYREFETRLDPSWKEFFISATDLNDAMADGINRVMIGVHSGLNRAGHHRCRVKSIQLDPERERFIISLTWVKDPSRLRTFLQRRH